MEGNLTIQIKGVVFDRDTLQEVLSVHGVILIDREKLALATFDGYLKRYYELCGIEKSYAAAWRRLEDEYFALYGKNRFSSWDSFRTTSHFKKRARKRNNIL